MTCKRFDHLSCSLKKAQLVSKISGKAKKTNQHLQLSIYFHSHFQAIKIYGQFFNYLTINYMCTYVYQLIIYMKKILHSDWLRAVQFFFKQCRKELIQCKKRKQTKHSDWSMIRETHRWPIKSFVFKSSARPGWRN